MVIRILSQAIKQMISKYNDDNKTGMFMVSRCLKRHALEVKTCMQDKEKHRQSFITGSLKPLNHSVRL